jgi:hypothetical protein
VLLQGEQRCGEPSGWCAASLAGCAFVQYSSWAACEAAIEVLHDKKTMPGSDHPLVVKFADAKKSDTGLLQKRVRVCGGAAGDCARPPGGHRSGKVERSPLLPAGDWFRLPRCACRAWV